MADAVKLSSLPVGECGYVREVSARPDMARRLEDLGVVPGTQVTCRLKSPAGDPRAYLIRGTLLALRRADADGIWVEPWKSC